MCRPSEILCPQTAALQLVLAPVEAEALLVSAHSWRAAVARTACYEQLEGAQLCLRVDALAPRHASLQSRAALVCVNGGLRAGELVRCLGPARRADRVRLCERDDGPVCRAVSGARSAAASTTAITTGRVAAGRIGRESVEQPADMLGEEAHAVSDLAQHDDEGALLGVDSLRCARVHWRTQLLRSRHSSHHVHAGVSIACCCSGGCASSFSVRVVCAMCGRPKTRLAISSLAQDFCG